MNSKKDEVKKEIKDWLKKIGKDREWLAEKCAVEKSSVNGWFAARRSIPKTALAFIRTLMNDHESKQIDTSSVTKKELLSLPSPEGLDRITIEVEGDLQIRINQKALELGMTTSCWASLALEEAAGEPDIMARVERLYAKKNAERVESGGTSEQQNTGNAEFPENRRHLRPRSAEEDETA